MTCIAAVAAPDGTVVMGGDSAAIDDRDLSIGVCVEPKVWAAGPLLFGACGSFRVSQLLRWHLIVPTADPGGEALHYITGDLVDAIRNCLTVGGALTTWQEDSTEELTASGFLVGYRGRVFELFEDFGVGELANGYGAVGCGSPFALGVLAATEGMRVTPARRIDLALAAAERHSAGVRGPMTVLRQ